MLRTLTLTIAIVFAAGCFTADASAGILAEYNFQDSTVNSSDTDLDSIASPMSWGSDISPAISTSGANGNPAPGLVDQVGTASGIGDDANPDDEQFALDNNEYFSITVESNFWFGFGQISEFRFDNDSEGTGFATGDNSWALYSSVISGDFSSVTTADAIARGRTPRDNFSTQVVDLSTNPLFQGISDQTVEFRLYYWMTRVQTNSVKELRLDNFQVTGVVPEPASASLLTLGAAGLIRRRRDR